VDATFAIAVVGVVLGGLSLGWQLFSFALSGPRVRVTFQQGLLGPLGVMVAPPSVYTATGRQALEAQGYDEHVLVIEAINAGRFPATVEDWSTAFSNGATWSNPRDPRNPTLPYRLEPGTSSRWITDADRLMRFAGAFADSSDRAVTARAVIRLATNKRLRSRNALIVRPTGIVEAPRRLRDIAQQIRRGFKPRMGLPRSL
jgi:hypothetical protein